MKKVILSFLAVFFCVLVNAEVKTVVFSVNPKMHCENCENNIKESIRYTAGIKDIKTSVADNTVAVTFDSEKTTVCKIVKAFADAKYTVTPCKAGAKKCEGQCCKKCEGQCCKKAEGQCCKKAEGQCCKKAEGQCCKK